MIAAVRKLWSKRMDHHAPPDPRGCRKCGYLPTDVETCVVGPCAPGYHTLDLTPEHYRWLALLEAVNLDPDVELEVMARGDVLAAPLTDPIEAFEADLDLLALPLATDTLAGRTEAA
jgi:hypothetical protein